MISVWQKSEFTRMTVRDQIQDRWGDVEVPNYDPTKNCFTFNGWLERGYRVKRGEKGLESHTFVQIEDKETKATRKIQKKIYLFYIKQVEKVPEDQLYLVARRLKGIK